MASLRTANDLILEALANLGVLAAGQPIDPEDYSYVEEKIDAVFRKVDALEIVSLPDPTQVGLNVAFIPSAYFSDLADILAGECATKFGETPDVYQMLIMRGLGGVQGIDVGFGAAAKSLRSIVRGKPTGEVVRAEYF
jgi:hypothetical protein